MPFEKGHKLTSRRKRNRGGRPTREQAAAKATAKERAIELIEKETEKVVKKYLSFAKSDPATARHFLDKLLPDEYQIDLPQTASIEVKVKRRVESEKGDEPNVRPDRHHIQVRVGD